MKILYTGAFRVGSMTEARRQALHAMEHEVVEVDRAPYLDRGSYLQRKAAMHLLIGPGIAAYNLDLMQRARDSRPEMIYVDGATYLRPGAVAALRSTGERVVHYTSEYLGFRTYLYRHFFKVVPLFDVHVITNPLIKPILKEKGAKKVLLSEFGYDPILHRPLHLTPEDQRRYQAEAIFVGHREPATERMIVALRGAGIPVKVWGPGWWKGQTLQDRYEIQPIYGEEYVKALAGAKIGLCFLSKWNHNQSASRTFEIPAIGSFLMAERTADHLSYFEEGKEAEFFSSPEELVDKARYYLAHEDEREAIARAGHERCITSGYTQQDRMREILEAIA